MADTRFVKGENVLMMDYTPGVAVASGEVVVVGAVLTGIAHRPIAANALGALGIHGGIYEATGNGVIAAGTVVYWDNAANKLTATAAGNELMGITTTACGGDGQLCQFAKLLSAPVGA